MVRCGINMSMQAKALPSSLMACQTDHLLLKIDLEDPLAA